MSTPYSTERLADRAQIQDIMYRWCRAIDRLDLEAIRGVFHPDAIDMHGMYNGPVDGLLKWIEERHRTIPFSMHSISNMLIEFAGPDTALVETYLFCAQRYSAEGQRSLAQLAGGATGQSGSQMDLLVYGRYVDRFERRNGEWRIAHRTVAYDSSTMFEVPENSARMGADWTVGKRGNRSDFIYQARTAAASGKARRSRASVVTCDLKRPLLDSSGLPSVRAGFLKVELARDRGRRPS